MDLFQPKKKIVLPARKVVVKKILVCAHVRNVRTGDGKTFDRVPCDRIIESGWLCGEHDFKTLAKRPNPKVRNLNDEHIQTIKLTEREALKGPRVVVGLKHKIEFVGEVKAGKVVPVRMKVDPSKVMVEEPTDINLNEE